MKQFDTYKALIIIGAGRSGTNILRDTLTQLPGFGTWHCDEINYIWRYGNKDYKTDEFMPAMANPKVKQYIRGQFNKLQNKYNLSHLVEKTCANSLRVGFVHEVLPEAKYIFLVRDGRDVVASAIKRWKAPLNLPYIIRKARYVPMADVPYYATQYLFRRFFCFFAKDKKVSSWGPRFEGMDEMIKDKSLAEVCAAQWTNCVKKAAMTLASLKSDKFILLKYEKFVSHPIAELRRICDFLSIKIESDQEIRAVSLIKNDSVCKWKTDLEKQMVEKIMPYIRDTLKDYGYINS